MNTVNEEEHEVLRQFNPSIFGFIFLSLYFWFTLVVFSILYRISLVAQESAFFHNVMLGGINNYR